MCVVQDVQAPAFLKPTDEQFYTVRPLTGHGDTIGSYLDIRDRIRPSQMSLSSRTTSTGAYRRHGYFCVIAHILFDPF